MSVRAPLLRWNYLSRAPPAAVSGCLRTPSYPSGVPPPTRNLPTTLPLPHLLTLPAQQRRHDSRWRVSVHVCEAAVKTLDFPPDSTAESERAAASSSISMWALWQRAGQLRNRTCLYPSSFHKVGGEGGGGLQRLSDAKDSANSFRESTPYILDPPLTLLLMSRLCL